jgi:hypothetical protein
MSKKSNGNLRGNLEKFAASLTEKELEDFKLLLNTIADIVDLTKKIANVNNEYHRIREKNQRFILAMINNKALAGQKAKFLEFNVAFEKILSDYDAVSGNVLKLCTDWDKRDHFSREILTLIAEKKKKTEKIMKGIYNLLPRSKEQLAIMEKYYDSASKLLVRMKEFEKELNLFVN